MNINTRCDTKLHVQKKTSAQGDHRHKIYSQCPKFLIISEWRVTSEDNDMIMKNTTACNRTKRLSRWYLTEIMFTFIPIIIPAQRKQGSVRAVHRLRFTHQITAISRCLVAVDMRILSNPSTDLNAINTHSYDRHASQTSDTWKMAIMCEADKWIMANTCNTLQAEQLLGKIQNASTKRSIISWEMW